MTYVNHLVDFKKVIILIDDEIRSSTNGLTLDEGRLPNTHIANYCRKMDLLI